MHQTKYDQCVRLFTLLEQERRTIPECASTMELSEYAIKQLKRDPDYLEIRATARETFREQSLTQLHELANESILTLRDLMLSARSEFVRFQAAKQIGDWIGLGVQPEKGETDDRLETNEFLKQFMTGRDVKVTIESHQPKPLPQVREGGLLPSFEGKDSWTPSD